LSLSLRVQGSWQTPGLLLPFVLLSLLLAACQPTTEAAAPPVTAVASGEAPVSSPTSPPPLVVAEAATATALPSFALLPTPTVTAPAPPMTATAYGIGTEAITATETISGTPGITPTAGPTFTPPPPPDDSPDHFWFRRPVGDGGVTWTDKHYPYGSTRGGTLRTHHGVEFNVPYNTPILAVATGTVRVAGDDSTVAYGPHTNFYGNLVVIEHDYTAGGQPLFTLYAHLNEVLVTGGQQIAAGAVIGLSGATGVADGPHVHLEVRVGANSYNNTRNPLLWLYPFPGRGVIAGRVTWPNGEPVREVGVSIRRIDGPNPYQGTTTYASDSVNPDALWQENFVLDDVTAGYYEVIVNTGDSRIKRETWVHAYQTSFVELVVP
jgi:murein DD-endopeptidase MepM/ murein hydrolase activator NlpD